MGLVHQHSQGHRLRPNLYGGGTQCIRRLQRVSPLDAFGALGTPTDGNVEPSYPSAPLDLLLVLHLHPLHRQLSTAIRALPGNRSLVLFVYMLRDRPAVVLAIGYPGLAPRAFGVLFNWARENGGDLRLAERLANSRFVSQCVFSFWNRF